MRLIRGLADVGSGTVGVPEIFEGGVGVAVRRAVVIGNGFAGAENQCIGLIRTLGLANLYSLHRVTRPRGGFNEWLRWLPVSVHKKLDYVVKQICGNSRFQVTFKVKRPEPLPTVKSSSSNNYSNTVFSKIYNCCYRTSISGSYVKSGCAAVSHIPEADAKQIATMARENFEKDGPLLVVASGRDTIPVASYIKRLAPANAFVVQIQHPRSHLNQFDMALTVGALHQADSAALQAAASSWHDEFAPLPKPLVVVNIGGPTKNCQYGIDLAKKLTAAIKNVLWSCGSIRISFSRRTPQKVGCLSQSIVYSSQRKQYKWMPSKSTLLEQVYKILLNEFVNHPKIYIWNGEDPNPHMGHLAWADAFVITADSVSMLSEACSTGKPVYVIGAESCTWKFADFQRSLLERGVVRPFTGSEDMSESWSYSPLNDNAEAAKRVIEALSERGWTLRP
ncbi:Mitochondrial fission protein ELM1-like [Dillenia turbinata]|uniref:Mitochondrial fission protein ELM1-like n=1 Tax=Dillenia turbinata TaxID=194707 RepID=A0AAN8ZJU3_9MAGN